MVGLGKSLTQNFSFESFFAKKSQYNWLDKKKTLKFKFVALHGAVFDSFLLCPVLESPLDKETPPNLLRITHKTVKSAMSHAQKNCKFNHL